MLATQCLLQRDPKTFAINVEGDVGLGVTAKDIILAIIAKNGAAAARVTSLNTAAALSTS